MKTVILRSPRYPSDPFLKRAEDSAANAATSEQASAELAKAAQQSATDSENSHQLADDARVKAETAQGKAETAQEGAVTAQGKAETAQGAAEFAQGKAEGSQQAAETAQGKAETAQGGAETAQGKAKASEQAAAGSASHASEEANRSTEQADRAASEATKAAGYSSVVAAEGDAQVERLQAKGDEQATRATVEANRAMNEANRSGGYSAEASGHASRADAAADRADLISGIENVQEALRLAVVPIPDFHLPLVNDLTIAQGKGTPYQIDVSPAQDGSVMVDLPMYRGDLSRASKGTCLDKFTGQLTEIDKDQPRFENNGVLIEGSGTNLVNNSEDLTQRITGENIHFYGSPIVERVATDHPVNFFQFKANGSAIQLFYRHPTADHTATLSFFIKPRGVDGVIDTRSRLQITETSGTIKVLEPAGYKMQYTLEKWGDIYRFTETKPAALNTGYNDCGIHSSSDAIFIIGGLQAEKKPITTSYIPTSGTAATRTPDNLQTKEIYIHEEYTMTMVLDWGHVPQPGDSRWYYQWFLKDLSTNNRWGMFVNSNGIYHSIWVNGNTSTYPMGFPSPTKPDEAKGRFTIVQTATDVTYYFRDRFITHQLGSSSTGRVTGLTGHCRLFLGSDHSGNTGHLYGNIRDVRLWNRALTPEQISNL